MVIGAGKVVGRHGQARAVDPALLTEIEPPFGQCGPDDVERACALAEAAFDSYRETTLAQRAAFLERIADEIMAIGPALIERAMQETGLPRARLEGERGRTCNQLRLFAQVVRAGRWLAATLDSALPDRTPPRADLRLRKIPLGPVAVFGASNFPLAFSVAGGDTASAFAAGCPVVVKAHAAHPGTSELVAKAVQRAVAACGLHEGVFSMLIGAGRTIGQMLVSDPRIGAVGFTGSRAGGMALVRTAAERPVPIPVYAEMSSINPVFMLPGALARSGPALAQGYVDSLTLGAGQFCTNPGLLIAIAGPDLDAFLAQAAAALNAKPAATMLTPGIHQAYAAGVEQLAQAAGVVTLAEGQSSSGGCAARAALYQVEAEIFLSDPTLEAELFGPASLIVRCRDLDDMRRVAQHVEGQLTATMHAAPSDHAYAAALLPVLERKAGRLVFNGFPTGVEVSHAMVHGGPFPSTSDSRSTSVGANAIERFLRPVCYQDVPEDLLPLALQAGNPLGIPRLIDGELHIAG
ncbi:MAG: aldehyde dehydrogenase (NADP(+)) [Pelomonas sp.]|nr:aldehyde dehydrogenase (NADP(+)) [Roseateles sp.]